MGSRAFNDAVLLVLLLPLSECLRGWQLPSQSIKYGLGTSLFARSRRAKEKSTLTTTITTTTRDYDEDKGDRRYTITYSPNFNRHLVSYYRDHGKAAGISTSTGTSGNTKKTAIRSYLWLDEALKDYPNATLDQLDLPPPFPPSTTRPPPHQQQEEQQQQALLLSRIVAGAGVNESTVYYNPNSTNSQLIKPGSPAMKNNGGTYLYRFLAKLYSAVPSISPAEIHRGVMDKFPRIAFYDAALVHERLFFLLSPLPPKDVLDNLRQATQVKPIKRSKLIASSSLENSTNSDACAFFDDFPLLFYKYGYGAGLSKFQLAQALQSLPQYWLPIYLGDALASTRKPQDVLPYIFYHLNSHPNAFRDATQDLDHLLTGTAWADVASLAHAKSSLKLSGDQCQMLLHAFPTLRTSDTEPTWEFYQKGPVRPMLMEESLTYLRIRLQLDPVQIFSLIKTHTRLSSYTVNGRLKPILDALQSKLELQSKELQQLILRMPSLLGMSLASLDVRINFFLMEVGMTIAQLKKSVLELPALLQYAVPNLETKLTFFREDLHIQERSLVVTMLIAKPILWGLSVEQNLKPTATNLRKFCKLSCLEVGELVSQAPELLVFNWSGNLEPKLRFLTDRLDLNPTELKRLVMSSPRILTYSLNGALSVKIDMLEEYLRSQSHKLNKAIKTKDVLLQIPSLLLVSKSRLSARLSKPDAFNNKLQTALAENGSVASVGTRGRKRGVVELSLDGNLLREYSTVKEAAAMVGTSVPNLYRVLREGKVLRNKKYAYKETNGVAFGVFVQRREANKDRVEGNGSKLPSSELSHQPKTDEANLFVYVSGRVYPPDKASQARGTRRVGGMVVAMPSLSKSFATLLRQALQDLYATQLLGLKTCQLNDKRDGLVAQIGYTNLEASRRRCSLYACFVSLRVVTQLFVLIGKASKAYRSQGAGSTEGSCPPTTTHIVIVTDSSYVFELLSDTGRLWEWGSALKPEEFVYTGRGSKWFANTDILWALSRAYYKLVDPDGAISAALQENISVSFVLDTGNSTPIEAAEFRDKMDCWGKEAAQLFYQRSYPYQEVPRA